MIKVKILLGPNTDDDVHNFNRLKWYYFLLLNLHEFEYTDLTYLTM